ncbi:hypothetical protein BDV96DRAFT_486706 [Lophiotrema nucula]|uniref:Heterokaryon incompatibility domain-containing protein n=1 Tax=Lophiotrema nucula TaxID=690887 RepID=A0A6A5ZJK8_9PLEO|nr:hypothetical protein BDV96DRAFT_486706 [Lophiotrema nucula]
MKNDLHLTFGEIFNGDLEAFRDQLIEIQDFQTSRDASEEWVQHLRFLDISHVPLLDGSGDEEPANKRRGYKNGRRAGLVDRPARWWIPLTRKEADDGDTKYIAVSWKWGNPRSLGADPSFDYRIRRPGRTPHKSDFPDHYLERVIRFAQYQNISNLWIDKECIYQRPGDDSTDQSLGIQIMDVVYESSVYSAGLLQTPITKQAELDALDALLSLSIFITDQENDNESVCFEDDIDTETVEIVIRKLLNDPRWTRAWIFQEDHLASHRMTLLIPCSEALFRRKHHRFGTISNELLVQMYEFKQAVTMFCVAAGDDRLASEFLAKVKQYNIWNKRIFALHSQTTTLSILEDICSRDLEKEHDRIAIMANASRFPVRLDVGENSPLVRRGAYSLSTALLALILMNGEIVKTDSGVLADTVLNYTLREYLSSWQYKFIAPGNKFEQTFIDHCRLISPIISRSGLRVRGFVFQLLPRFQSDLNPVGLTRVDEDDLSRQSRRLKAKHGRRRRKLNRLHEEVIEILIEKLRNTYGHDLPLADFLYHHLELDRDPPPPDVASPLTKYLLDMLSALAAAVLAGRDVRLAKLEDVGEEGAPSAIFVAPPTRDTWLAEQLPNETEEPPRVFVSFDKGWTNRGMERIASLEVTLHRESTRTTSNTGGVLTSSGWVNGLWDVRDERMSSYVFPLPGICDAGLDQDE